MTTPHPGALALQAQAARLSTRPRADHPETLYTMATRTWRALQELADRANPACPTCNGIGWTRQRVEHGFAGEEARACHCTGVA